MIAASAAVDCEDIENAALECAFRKAFAGGDMATAGRMLRALLRAEGEKEAMQEFAQDGIRVACGRKSGSAKSAKHAKEGAAQWQRKCCAVARALLAEGLAPHKLAGLLARRFNKSARAVRGVLRAAGIKKKRK